MILLLWLFGLIALSPPAWAASLSQHTTGSCSPAVSVGAGNVRIECRGVDRNEVNELVKIFNEGLRSFKEFQKEILERQPDINVRCTSDEQADPSKLLCFVSNDGRGEARDILIAFTDQLPVDTVIQAPPELGIKIEEAGSPPDPANSPEVAKLLTAFVVRIPRLAAKERFSFVLLTTNDDNIRAAKQVIRIRKEITDVLEKFWARLRHVYPNEAAKWNLKEVLNWKVKDDNFYSPGKFSYEKGRFPVAFFTDGETVARAINQDLYARYKKEFIDIYLNRPSYLAPVIRVKSRNGERTYARMPPYVTTCIAGSVRIPEKPQTFELPIPVPDYDRDKC
jgi:hypothetical protein